MRSKRLKKLLEISFDGPCALSRGLYAEEVLLVAVFRRALQDYLRIDADYRLDAMTKNDVSSATAYFDEDRAVDEYGCLNHMCSVLELSASRVRDMIESGEILNRVPRPRGGGWQLEKEKLEKLTSTLKNT